MPVSPATKKPNTKKRLTYVILAGLVIFGGVFGFVIFRNQMIKKFMAHFSMPPAQVRVIKASEKTIHHKLHAVGVISAIRGISVTSQTAGTVTKVLFQPGKNVQEGDLLVALDSASDEAALEKAEAALSLAKSQYNRGVRLARNHTISQTSFDQIKSTLRQAEATVKSLQATLSYKNITAPFSGKVGLQNISVGQYITPGTAITELQDVSQLKVTFSLPEQDAPKIALGQPLDLKFDAFPQKIYQAKIDAISPRINGDTHTISVEGVFTNKDKALIPGMFADVTIILPQEYSHIMLPATSVSYNLYGDSVFILKKNDKNEYIAHSVHVDVGATEKDKVEILSGIKQGDIVAIDGILKLRNNARVIPHFKQITP